MPDPKKNTAYTFYVSLVDSSSRPYFRANPSISAGDFQVSTDGSAFTNLATLPTVDPAGSIGVKIQLSSGEMNGDRIMIQCIDAVGGEWDDCLIYIDTTTNTVDDLSTQTSVNTLDSEVTNIQGRIPAALTANGNMKSSLVEILTTALTETVGQIAAAFKQFFDVGTPTGTMKSITNVVTTTNVTNDVGITQAGADRAWGTATRSLTDKSGFSLTQTFPTNFSDLAITAATGRVTVGTNADKTGYTASTVTDKTGYSISGTKQTLDALNDIPASAILTTALTESYAADGAAPTLAQFLYQIWSAIGDFSISGTTITCKKLDGTTTSMTFTLDDGTNPTSRTRAT